MSDKPKTPRETIAWMKRQLDLGMGAVSIGADAARLLLERVDALERLWETEKNLTREWYPEPRNEYERALDDLARMDMEALG